MALSGSIETATYKPDGSKNTWKVLFNWTATQNISDNTSTISWELVCSTTSTSYVTINELEVKFDDEVIYYRGTSKKTQGYDGVLLASGTKIIDHNSDGQKTINVSIGAGIYIHAINRTGSGVIELDIIPRSSEITSVANVYLGQNCQIKWKPANYNFKYKLEFSLGEWNHTTDYINPNSTDEYTYDEYEIPQDVLLPYIPDDPYEIMFVVLYTYDADDTQIGSKSEAKTFTVSVPLDIKPSIGEIRLTSQTYDCLIKGKNSVVVSVSECLPGYGSNIKSYTFSGPGLSYTGIDTSAVSGIITDPGELIYTITVTDTRGRSTSVDSSIICHDYAAPRFTSFNAYRTLTMEDTPNTSGTYIRCPYKVLYSSVGGTNSVSVKIHYVSNNHTYPDIESSGDSGVAYIESVNQNVTYTVYATVSDKYGGSSSSTQKIIFGSFRAINITKNGTGIALGKMAESDDLFECRWAAKFNESVDCKSITINEKTIFDLIYPIGSIYMNVNSINPSDIFGGDWEVFQEDNSLNVYMWKRTG